MIYFLKIRTCVVMCSKPNKQGVSTTTFFYLYLLLLNYY